MGKKYTVEEFFNEHKEVTISGVAKQAKMNASLLRQYASGVKKPASKQRKRIEKAIHELGLKLTELAVSLNEKNKPQ